MVMESLQDTLMLSYGRKVSHKPAYRSPVSGKPGEER